MNEYAFHPEGFADLDQIWDSSPSGTSTLPIRYLPTSTPSSAPSSLRHVSDTGALT